MNSSLRTKRLLRELHQLKKLPSPHISLDAADNIDKWIVRLHGVEHTIYANEEYTLLFEFPTDYPIESPVVTFVGTVPVHPHVYSNGHICLSILYMNWCPVLTVDAICQSVLSMLSGCEKKVRPDRDYIYIKQAKASPKDTVWLFDDIDV
ncbi:putative ubiquitin-conjugating enzyme E2 W [Kickxella alabastrina]|uniref:putative ubiquitin-conjugating enzyme E2 W n=1 Tax=Kickxella alabastrina TaxID=61397 RepID=UPI00221EED08|nr:putative ubiquitin-conjugating enzyme E2 W [Kickxella alabastrina]KAI7825485.1 putative ubiquitin-conjugating enzyme E2 W [Kickxella alabastrina]